ncbi:MAG TPA: ATP-dependent sacrificial sulfur transferase LarE [Acidimicrobiales bacterium]
MSQVDASTRTEAPVHALRAPADTPASGTPASGTIEALQAELSRLGRVVVAFSGGADSAFLARVAHDLLGPDSVLCVTAVSPSLAPEEAADCRALAAEWGLRWAAVPTAEMDDPAYVANGADRCAHCKTALMDVVGPLAGSEGATVVLGVNLDDLGDHRPGQAAAAARGARFPLVDAGFTKASVREWSRRIGLRTWDKPAAACLASRVAYGTPVTVGTLGSVARAETALRRLGFTELRVRHHGPVARIEVPEAALAAVVERRDLVVDAVRSAGYDFVALDLEGLRSGSLNRVLGDPADGSAVPLAGATSVAGANGR